MREKQKLPNLILGGPGRTGTTSLFEYFIQHPNICGARKKETNYFLNPLFNQPLAPVETYLELFNNCWQADYRYVLEATPAYFLGGRAVAASMKNVLGDFKIIFTLRDPVERFISGYWHIKSKVLIDETLSYEKYLARSKEVDLTSLSSYDDLHYAILAEGIYAELLTKWYESLDNDAIYILFYEDFMDGQMQALRGLLGWLGIEPSDEMETLPHTNKAMEFRFAILQKMARVAAQRGELFFKKNPGLKKFISNIYYGLNAKGNKGQCPQEVKSFLKNYYREPNRRLAALLQSKGMSELPSWLGAR